MKLSKSAQAYAQFKADFASICEAYGGTRNEHDGYAEGSSFNLPTHLGVLKASIQAPYGKRAWKIESIFLRFETHTSGKVCDTLCGYNFNGYSGKWNITIGAADLATARLECLLSLGYRLEKLKELEAVKV